MATTTTIAKWTSKGGRWTAQLEHDDSGFTLREFKHGQPCGASYRPWGFFEEAPWYAIGKSGQIQVAKVWAAQQVAYGFDVAMSRVAI